MKSSWFRLASSGLQRIRETLGFRGKSVENFPEPRLDDRQRTGAAEARRDPTAEELSTPIVAPPSAVADAEGAPEPWVAPEPTLEPQPVPVEIERTDRSGFLRLGVDFGTSTIQVATYIEGQDPQLIQLEDLTDEMPSYVAFDRDGTPRVGLAARNTVPNFHSIKPLLEADDPIDGVGHPTKLAFLILEDVVRRTLAQLRLRRLLPDAVDRLEVATNLGCTPAFSLDTRVRLRDVARRAGLRVDLVSLIEEPVAAAYEIMLSGLVSNGVVIVIDMGGGTLDTAVVRVSRGGRAFELFASGGSVNAGDRFTEVIAEELLARAAELVPNAVLTNADRTLAWDRAEAAKQSLSVRPTAVVALGGIGGLETETTQITREWLERETRGLRVRVEADVATVYRIARLVLNRGGQFDPNPGTIDFDEPAKGKVRRLTEVGLRDDAQQHVDHVVLVGGATHMPQIQSLFRSIFPGKLIEPELGGIDRSSIVALGLARPKPAGMVSLNYPSWGVSAIFGTSSGQIEVPMYEPFAPAFTILNGRTSTYRHGAPVPQDAISVALAFRSVDGEGVRWPDVPIKGHPEVALELDLFGQIEFTLDGAPLYDDFELRAPWSPAEASALPSWLPPWREREWWKDMPTWDLVNDK